MKRDSPLGAMGSEAPIFEVSIQKTPLDRYKGQSRYKAVEFLDPE